MSNKRWNPTEKIELMKLFSMGKSYEDIGKSLNRSPNAIKLRLEAIVYTNLEKGKSIGMLSKMLNTDIDKIKQLYYSHKSFKQGRGEPVKDIEFPPNNDGKNKENISGGNSTHTNSMSTHAPNFTQKTMPMRQMPMRQMQRHIPNTGFINRSERVTSNPRFGARLPQNPIPQPQNILQNGGVTNNISHKEKLKKLENENHVLEEIIKNHKMKKHLKKLYIDGKLDRKSAKYYKKLLIEKQQIV